MSYFPSFEDTSSYMEYIGNESVTLIVGPELKEYSVHKKILCRISPFFDKAFNAGFRESQENKMSLPEDKADMAGSFVAWLYGQDLDRKALFLNADYLTDLYIFADSKQCNILKDAVINICQDNHIEGGSHFEYAHMQRIFTNIVKVNNEGIRKYCGAFCHWKFLSDDISPEQLTERFESCPGLLLEYLNIQLQFNKDLMELGDDVKNRRGDPAYRKSRYFPRCYFHIHGGDGEFALQDDDERRQDLHTNSYEAKP